MRVSFYSNYMNHHQLPLSDALYSVLGDEYTFVATTPVNPARLALGYRDENKSRPYILTTYDSIENQEKALRLALESDVVISGSAPEIYSRVRITHRKLLLRYSERLFKQEPSLKGFLGSFVYSHIENPPFSKTYLLCASAYTAPDYERLGLFRNRAFKWGYFPEFRPYDYPEALIRQKEPSTLLWAGRFLDWKHPELAIEIADTLRNNGYHFKLNMIGTGEMETYLKNRTAEMGLDNCVHFLGSMPPEQVRQYMEESQIFLFTSDRNEGWGAVLNEAMNSACAVVANQMIGSVPFLIRNGDNGLIYQDDDTTAFFDCVKRLMDHSEETMRLGSAAYHTVADQWNAEIAAQRLLTLSQDLLRGNTGRSLFSSGVCSPAILLSETSGESSK